jgi:hypothetical protein
VPLNSIITMSINLVEEVLVEPETLD